MAAKFADASIPEIEEAMQSSYQAFLQYRKISLKDRSFFLSRVGDFLQQSEEALIDMAHEETNLDKNRLRTELARTIYQLKAYGEASARGNWLQLRIEKADPTANPPRPDLRKMLVPLGPVVVFGASNFPFAYSTAGGDTASALAAGCSVILKAHPAHAGTSAMVANIIQSAATSSNIPASVFIHLHGASFEIGKALVQHPLVKAVGFTGSLEGGRALYDWAAQRPEPIPIFAEMGSVNPVCILPGALAEPEKLANKLGESITGSAGQFCTKPGLIIGINGNAWEAFTSKLTDFVNAVPSVRMLHEGIATAFHKKRNDVLTQNGVSRLSDEKDRVSNGSLPTLATIDAAEFLKSPAVRHEVFGPFALVVNCGNEREMEAVLTSLEGQLTCSFFASEDEMIANALLLEKARDICGRIICNGVPTGVTVSIAMHHGGPYPATTDSRFTAVGDDAIMRFARPVCFQNIPDTVLPEALQDANPLGFDRIVI